MSEKISYDDLLYLFEQYKDYIDETAIYFDDDPKEYEHYLGYIPEVKGEICDKPYWIGYCDINGGWNSEDFMEMYGEEFLNNRRTADKK